MAISNQREKAESFRKLHDRSRILVLPNAWDVASAKIFEAAGFPAVATTSSGVANSLGYPDGEVIPRAEMIALIARIADRLEVPLSADIEGGYAPDLESLKKTIRTVIEAGAVGINLEDGMHSGAPQLHPLETATERVRAARSTADASGVPLVINARVDVFLYGIGEKSERLDHAVKRANAYRAAGADCLFIPGPADAATIGKLTAAIDGPVNVMVLPGMPSTRELEKLGVARVSMGGGPARAALTTVRRIAEELRDSGTYSIFTSPETIPHVEANKLVSKKKS